MGTGATLVCIACGLQARWKEQVKYWAAQPCPGEVAVEEISMARRFRIGLDWWLRGTGGSQVDGMSG